MSEPGVSQGVLDAQYARERTTRLELAFRYRVRARVVADALRRFLPRYARPRLLDLGCADGRTLAELEALLPAGSELVGIERSEELLAQAPALPANVELVCGDVAKLPEAVRGPFDVVSALAVLEHLPDPAQAVCEAARVLRPGGLFVATCPSPTWDGIATRLGLLADEQHEVELDRTGLIGLATGAGLEVLAFERFMWAPVGLLPYLRVPVSPDTALRLDRLVSRLRLLDFGFVNQALIARRP